MEDTSYWLTTELGYVKRKVSNKAKIAVENLASLKEQFFLDFKNVVDKEEIPQDSILNWDQTAIYYVRVSNWTMGCRMIKKNFNCWHM